MVDLARLAADERTPENERVAAALALAKLYVKPVPGQPRRAPDVTPAERELRLWATIEKQHNRINQLESKCQQLENKWRAALRQQEGQRQRWEREWRRKHGGTPATAADAPKESKP